MTRDISALLKNVTSALWPTERSLAALETLGKAVDTLVVIDWDRGAGEEWARIVTGRKTVGYVSMKKPLAVLEDGLSQASVALEQAGFQVLTVPSMTERCLSARRTHIEEWAGRAISDALDPNEFSMEEFWWATV